MALDSDRYVTSLDRESEALASAAAAAGPDTQVPSCPGWSVSDLLVHCGSGNLWARTIVEQRSLQRVSFQTPEDLPSGSALVPWFLEGAKALVAALAAIDPSTPVWTFSPADRTATFWRRRRAHETAVHRFDAQLAAGTPGPIDPELASDGVDEFFVTLLPRLGEAGLERGESIHLHCTDAAGEWLLQCTEDGVKVTREHAKAGVAVRGPASDLMLFVWGRLAASGLEVFGDSTVLDRFSAAIRV